MKTILVVDDERDLLSAVAGVLRDEGYDVCECADATEALEYLATRRPDVALVDVMMPVMSGLELLQRMRSMPALDGVPVVLMSAAGDLSDARRGADKPDAFLKKPFQLKRLLATVAQLAGAAVPTAQRSSR